MKPLLIIIFAICLTAASCTNSPINNQEVTQAETPTADSKTESNPKLNNQTIDLSTSNPAYKFSVVIPSNWKLEYISANESVNLYDPNSTGSNNLEKSQIFIRYFKANSFLTLNTVDIIKREETSVGSRAAVAYEIKKKPSVPNFPNQPLWRSAQHSLIDIRYTNSNPSEFYVIARNPNLDPAVFDTFLNSLKFETR